MKIEQLVNVICAFGHRAWIDGDFIVAPDYLTGERMYIKPTLRAVRRYLGV